MSVENDLVGGGARPGIRQHSGAMGVGAVSNHGTNWGEGVKRWGGGVLYWTCFIFFCRHLEEAGGVSSIHYLLVLRFVNVVPGYIASQGASTWSPKGFTNFEDREGFKLSLLNS